MAKSGMQNLIPASERSLEEVRENGRKGGLKSGETRRRQKLIRELFNEILPREVSDDELREVLLAEGLPPTYEMAMSYAAIKRAVKGDIEAARFVRDTLGQKPAESLAIAPLLDRPLHSIDMSKLTDEQLQQLAAQRAEEEPQSLPPAQ